MWHQRYSNETASRIPHTQKKSTIDDLGQSGENCYPEICVLLKNIRDSTDKDEYQQEIVFYTAGNKNIPAKGKWTRSIE